MWRAFSIFKNRICKILLETDHIIIDRKNPIKDAESKDGVYLPTALSYVWLIPNTDGQNSRKNILKRQFFTFRHQSGNIERSFHVFTLFCGKYDRFEAF